MKLNSLRLFGYSLSGELFSGSLSFDKVTVTDIKQSVEKAILKRGDRIDPEGLIKKISCLLFPLGLDLLLSLLQDNPEKRTSAEDALNHPYFETLRQNNANEETIIMNSPM